jgi:hypothetical protein
MKNSKAFELIGIMLLLNIPICLAALAWADDEYADSKYLKLSTAVACEDVKDHTPYNPAAVFSISDGKVFCFSLFDTVTEKGYVYHNWYRADKLATRKKLAVNPPKWSTFSTVHLRDTDKGPWRVEISDQDGKILTVLRFSITE